MAGAALEEEIRRVGTDLAGAFPSSARHPLKAIDAKALDLASQDAELRTALFRFVDVAPACHSVDDLAAHLAGFLDEVDEMPPALAAAARMADRSAAARQALGRAAAAGVRHMAHRFIVAETPHAAGHHVRRLWHQGVATSVDLLGEATVTTAEADRYAARCRDALERLAAIHEDLPHRLHLERDSHGPLPRPNLSVKVSALTPLLRPEAPERGIADAGARLRELFRVARRLGAHLHIDMESLDSREAVSELVLTLLAEEEFREGPSAGVVLQAYLRDSGDLLDRLIAFAGATPRRHPLVVRLVKGAYWDHEVVEARRHGWPAPVFDVKAECDRHYEALTVRMLEARPGLRVAIASHNLRSVSHAIAANRRLGADDGDVELQVLRGLGDDLQDALAAQGFRVRTYCPVGDMVAGMAYLVRRLLENSSSESFLHEQAKGTPIEELLAAP